MSVHNEHFPLQYCNDLVEQLCMYVQLDFFSLLQHPTRFFLGNADIRMRMNEIVPKYAREINFSEKRGWNDGN